MFQKRYLIVSALFHGALIIILAVFYSMCPCEKDPPCQTLRVSIVQGIDPQGSGVVESGSFYQGRDRSVVTQLKSISIGSVEKEQQLQGPGADSSSREIQDIRGSEDIMPEAGGRGPLQGYNPDEIIRWRSSIQGIVESYLGDAVEQKNRCLEATCLLMVSRTGELLKGHLVVSSGNASFDSLVEESLGKISRLPPPPVIITAGAEVVDVTVPFTYPLIDSKKKSSR